MNFDLYSFADYVRAKHRNSMLERFEHMCDYMSERLGMPVVIAGLHSGFKNAISGQEKDIKNVNPRCVLTYTDVSLDASACTSRQEVAPILGVNDKGIYGAYERQYRRMPLTASFSGTIVMSNPAEAIKMSQYIMLMSFVLPTVKGDEHCKSTIIIGNDANIDHDNVKQDYNVKFSLRLNMQIIEPMSLAEDDTAYRLVGTGTQLPDGTWDEVTPEGELIWEYETDALGNVIVDSDGMPVPKLDDAGNKIPVLDEDGNQLIGHYVFGGWWRLHTRIHVHSHLRWEDCLEDDASIHHERKAVAELAGVTSVAMPPCPEVNSANETEQA